MSNRKVPVMLTFQIPSSLIATRPVRIISRLSATLLILSLFAMSAFFNFCSFFKLLFRQPFNQSSPRTPLNQWNLTTIQFIRLTSLCSENGKTRNFFEPKMHKKLALLSSSWFHRGMLRERAGCAADVTFVWEEEGELFSCCWRFLTSASE